MSDFRATDSAGADMSIEWTNDGGARITVSGDQPLDQPACSIKRSREEMVALRDHLDAELGTSLPAAKSYSEWHEDLHEVLWWFFPMTEAPYVGSPLCSDWPGYHTHWTPLPALPAPPRPPAKRG